MKTTITAAIAIAALATPAFAQSGLVETNTITFDDLAPAPSTFSEAGGAQNFNLDGVTVSGGVLIGTELFGIAAEDASQPNIYGTVNYIGSHSRAITIDIQTGVNAVSGTIYNGLNERVLFSFTALDAQGNVIDNELQTTLSLRSEGQHTFLLEAEGLSNSIAQVTINPVELNQYGQFNYAVDTLTFSRTIPTPGAAAGLGLAGLIATRRRR